jgi:hypothetical protein
MGCDPAASLGYIVVAVAAGVRYAVGRNADRLAGRTQFSILDRDQDPERFGFWQGVWLTVAIIAAVEGLPGLVCF